MVKNIQALRGIAALLVVFDHLGFAQSAVAPRGSNPTIWNTGAGAMGVDIFFVISGYVISMAATKREQFASGFFLARLARVAPLYLTLTIFKIIGDTALHNSESLRSLWNGFFYLPFFDRDHYTGPPLGMGWTLSFEMWFYTVFAIMIAILSVRRAVIFLPVVFGLGAVVMSFFQGPFYFLFFMFHPFVIEFSLGCLIFNFQGKLGRNLSFVLAAVGILLLILFRQEPGDPKFALNYPIDAAWHRVACWGCPAALLAAGCVGIERTTRWVFPRWLVGIGTISYSIYLTHGFVPRLIAAGVHLVHGAISAMTASLAMMVVSIMVGYACWRFIERPLTLAAQGWVARRWHVPIQEVTPVKSR